MKLNGIDGRILRNIIIITIKQFAIQMIDFDNHLSIPDSSIVESILLNISYINVRFTPGNEQQKNDDEQMKNFLQVFNSNVPLVNLKCKHTFFSEHRFLLFKNQVYFEFIC